MTSRLNYNTPLKSVRTIRALKIDQCDPQTIFVHDPTRLSDADLMKEAGVAFVWENAPGRSKVVEQEKGEEKSDAAAPSLELKLPPQQILPPPPASKVPSVEIPKSPPPAGTSPAPGTNSRHSYNLFANNHASPPEAAAAYTSSAPNSRSKSSANHHQLPPKPSHHTRVPPSVTVHQQQQSSDKPPLTARRTASASVPQSGHHHSTSLSHNGGCDPQSGQRTSGARGGENPVTTEDHHHLSSLASTLHSVNNNGAAVPHSGLLYRGSDFAPDGERNKTGPYSDLNRGSQDYLAERLRQAPMHVVKDFYLSGRHTTAGTVPSSAHATRPNSCMPTRPNSASASEAGSHSDDDGDQTDAGDESSHINMNSKDFDARCQVSTLDGELHETSRHTDPHARDFIMERFLPAAKAMVTETAEASDRRSAHGIPSVSPTRGKGRPSLPGRSRFAFQDRFADDGEEQQQEDIDQSGMLFKCKFPWQTGALKGAGQVTTPPDSRSVEQSPSAYFANSNESSPGPYNDDQRNALDSDGSATPKGDNSSSFEDRRLPSKDRNNNVSYIPRSQTSRIGEADNRGNNGTLSSSGELASREYERELTRRSNDTNSRQFAGVPTDRLDETATHGDFDNGNSINVPRGKRSPVMAFSGSLGTLLKATQLQRRDQVQGKNYGLGNPAAAANVQESIPPSSILNHHRYNHSHAAAAAYDSTNSARKPSYHSNGVHPNESNSYPRHPSYHSNGVHPNESNSYPRHLNVDLVRRQNAEPSGSSGSSLESFHDDVWEAGREPISGSNSPAPDNYDPSGKVLTTSNSPEAANDEMHASGWPLGKGYTAYARTPSSDSKDASFSSISDHSLPSPSNQGFSIQSNQQEKSSSEKVSPVSVLQPPLPKSPAESWLFKVRPPVPPSRVTNWQGPKPKKFLDYSLTDDSMDVKWEVLVKSENAQLRNKLAQEVPQKGPGLDKSEILGSKAR